MFALVFDGYNDKNVISLLTLQFYDGYDGKEIGRVCGNQPTSLFGRSDFLVVVFRTDNDVVSKGWNMSWPAGQFINTTTEDFS